MADLLVHAASMAPGARLLRDGRIRALLFVGVCLPDLLYKTLLYVFGAPTWLCEPTHSPLGVLAWCWLLALLFEPEWRTRAFWALAAGCWLHQLVDLGKNYLGSGVILWAFPFSNDAVELGWYTNDDTLLFAPFALLILLLFGRRQRF